MVDGSSGSASRCAGQAQTQSFSVSVSLAGAGGVQDTSPLFPRCLDPPDQNKPFGDAAPVRSTQSVRLALPARCRGVYLLESIKQALHEAHSS